jgi:transcriptional regulator with XRE-family HTH domain
MTTAREQLGKELARARMLAGLSGRAMADRLGVSQSTLSRMENGRAAVSIPQVRIWASATGVDSPTSGRLLELVEAAYGEALPWQSTIGERGFHLQDGVRDREAAARTIEQFQPTAVPGLLQTAAYATALFPLVLEDDVQHDHAAAVAGRMRRQEILYQPGRRFEFMLHESAFTGFQPGGANIMAGQIDRIAQLATLPSIWLGLLPAGPIPGAPINNFVIFDDHVDDTPPYVEVELIHGESLLRDPDIVETYRRQWNRWRDSCLVGRDAVERIRHVLGKFEFESLGGATNHA